MASAVVFSESLNGAAVTAAPEFVPSTLNCTLVVFDDTVVVTVTVPDTVAPDAGELMDMVGAVGIVHRDGHCRARGLSGSIARHGRQRVTPVGERRGVQRVAERRGADRRPRIAPIHLELHALVFDDTVVVTVTVPDTVAPDVGELMDMVGAVALFTVMGTAALVVCPEASLATAVNE